MKNRQHFDIEDRLNELFTKENLSLPVDFKRKLISLISMFPTYEEEEMKIYPNIILGNDILKTLENLIGTGHVLKVAEDNIEAQEFSKKMKTLLPFCNTGWHVFIDIDIQNQKIYYGIARNYTGVSGFNLKDDIFDMINEPLKMVFIETLDKKSIFLQGIKDELLIDFRLFKDNNDLEKDPIKELCQDLISGITDPDHDQYTYRRHFCSKAFQKFFYMAERKIHGTILLVIDADNDVNNIPESLKDGNWLNPEDYLDLSASIETVLAEQSNNRLDIEKHYSLTGLLISMLNIDGITIMNNKGQIVAYNVFLKQTFIEEIGISGGARTRTALSLKSLHNEQFKIKGIYFQSQDGNKHYEKVGV